MSTIQELFQQTQLAEATYANFFNGTGGLVATKDELIAALTNKDAGGSFSAAQATDFANHWRIVDQYTASGGLLGSGSGFSATVFQNIDTGAYTFATRGTEFGPSDLLNTDLGDIVADGLALDQIVDMYNYWQRLTHLGVYQAAVLETRVLETAKLELLWAQTTLPGGPAIYANYVAELQAAGMVVDMGLLGPSARAVLFDNSTNVYTDWNQRGQHHI